MKRDELQRVRDWADQKVTMGAETPWAWYQYKKLREAADAILLGMDSTRSVTVPVDPREAEQRRGIGHLRLVDNCPPNSAQPDPEADWYLCPCDVEVAP
jgi:hypothetical protein